MYIQCISVCYTFNLGDAHRYLMEFNDTNYLCTYICMYMLFSYVCFPFYKMVNFSMYIYSYIATTYVRMHDTSILCTYVSF